MSQNQENAHADNANQEKSVQLPMILSHDHISNTYVNVFQTRVVDGMIAVSYGLSYPDQATDSNGQKQPVYAVELEGRLVMSLDTAKRLSTVLAQTIQQLGDNS